MTSEETTTDVEEMDEEQTEETTTEDEEQTTDEEQTNEETTTDNDDNEYVEKIAELDARLSAFKAQKVDAAKREQMEQVGYTDDQIERYISHVTGESVSDIKASVSELMNEIPVNVTYGDPSVNNGMNTQVKATDGRDLGRKMFDKVRHKVRGFK